ncbi:MAG: glycosyltransferase [Paucibacter sp.]|nr:glycosyltransferase [Roseateles sp.]
MNDIRISVVIPAYNAAEFIVDALESVAAQTHLPVELILINDGSRDHTSAIARQWALGRNLPFEFIVIDIVNQGPPGARNTGIRRATGDWIALLDSDDIFEATHLEQLASAIRRTPDVVAAYGAGRLFVDNVLQTQLYDDFWDRPSQVFGKPVPGTDFLRIGRDAMPRLIQGNFIKPSSLMFSAKVLDEVGIFNESLRTSEDREFLVRLLFKGDFIYCPHPITKYRWHTENMTQPKNAQRNSENMLRALLVIAAHPKVRVDRGYRRACTEQMQRVTVEYLYSCSQTGLAEYFRGLRLVLLDLRPSGAWRALRLRHLLRSMIAAGS